MKKRVGLLSVSILLLLLLGCHPPTSSAVSTQVIPASNSQSMQYLTALEAYAEIRPTMLEWHSDAIVCGIYSSHSEQAEDRVHADGKAIEWNFVVYSPEAQKRTDISWTNEEIHVGISDASGGEIPASEGTALPIEKMLDSDQAIQIAWQNSGNISDTLYYITTEGYDGKSGKYIPISWGLTYGHLHNWSQQKVILVDMATSEILRDDFNPPLSTPTVIMQPLTPNQLTLYTYGDFDLLVINARGLSLGVEPGSKKTMAEIPDAWQNLDTGFVAEDVGCAAATVLMNPLEGRYRVQVHGPGEPEKHCRMIVDISLGTGENARREVEIPCQSGVSAVYEFTLMLSGEELLSDIKQE